MNLPVKRAEALGARARSAKKSIMGGSDLGVAAVYTVIILLLGAAAAANNADPAVYDEAEALRMLEKARRLSEDGDLYKATKTLEDLVQFAPQYGPAWNLLGTVRTMAGDNVDTLHKLFRAAVAVSPEEADTHVNLGFVLEEIGNTDGAARAYYKGVSLDPTHSRAHEVAHRLGIIGYGRGEVKQALKWLRFSVEANSSVPDSMYDLAVVLGVQGDKPGSIEMYRKVLTLDPGHIAALHNLHVATEGSEGQQATKEEIEARSNQAQQHGAEKDDL